MFSPSAPWTDAIRRYAVVGGRTVDGFVTDNGAAFRYVVGDRVRKTTRFVLGDVVPNRPTPEQFLRDMRAQALAEREAAGK